MPPMKKLKPKTSVSGPISRKILTGLRKTAARKIVDLSEKDNPLAVEAVVVPAIDIDNMFMV